MGRLKFSSLIIFLTFFLVLPSFSSESGWFRVRDYYKPFVKVKDFLNKQVLFITNRGKVYSGKCRKKGGFYNHCYIAPSKKFKTIDGGITFIVLKVDGYYPPRIVEFGTVDNFNVILKEER